MCQGMYSRRQVNRVAKSVDDLAASRSLECLFLFVFFNERVDLTNPLQRHLAIIHFYLLGEEEVIVGTGGDE